MTRAIQLDGTSGDYFNRGQAYNKKGDLENAISDYTQAIQLNPHDYTVYICRGIAYYKKGDLDRAIKDYTKSIRHLPTFDDAYYFRGLAYSDKGNTAKAIKDFQKILELRSPDSEEYQQAKEQLGKLEVE